MAENELGARCPGRNAVPAMSGGANPGQAVEWAEAFAAFDAARAAYQAHSRDVHDPASKAGNLTAEIGADNDALGAALGIAETALILAPAPDMGAVRYKLDLLMCDGSTLDMAELRAIAADLARLARPTDWHDARRQLDAWIAAEDAFYAAWTGDQPEAEGQRLMAEREAAEETVIVDLPAPDLAAAVWKFNHGRLRWAEFQAMPNTWLNAINADLDRFAAEWPKAEG